MNGVLSIRLYLFLSSMFFSLSKAFQSIAEHWRRVQYQYCSFHNIRLLYRKNGVCLFQNVFPYFCKTLLFNNTLVTLRNFIKEFFNLEICGTEWTPEIKNIEFSSIFLQLSPKASLSTHRNTVSVQIIQSPFQKLFCFLLF